MPPDGSMKLIIFIVLQHTVKMRGVILQADQEPRFLK